MLYIILDTGEEVVMTFTIYIPEEMAGKSSRNIKIT